jgi:uncharacterized protein YbjT (DUF2867 family)
LGRLVVDAATVAGHETVILARRAGVDLITGRGLMTALRNVDVVIDAAATTSASTKESVRFFGTATRNLLEAEDHTSVEHHVAVSVIGAAQVNSNYYAGKALQERILVHRKDGWSLLRTTQFHEFAAQLIEHGKVGPFQAVPKMRSQPIAASVVADALVRIAEGTPQRLLPDLAGPREERMADMVRRLLNATGQRGPVLEISLPGPWGRGMRNGTLIPGSGVRRAGPSFDDWLKTRDN